MAGEPNFRILIADDEPSITEGLSALLELENYQTQTCDDGVAAVKMFKKAAFDLVLVDLMMPGYNGLEVLKKIKAVDPETEVILITGKGTISNAVEAMKAGAYDYLTKPVDGNRLRTVIARALEHKQLLEQNKHLEEKIQRLASFEDMIGQDAKMRHIYNVIETVADTTANVFITGESGTGKELVARAIHNKSSRQNGPFFAVNCAAFPRDILESELFGHEKGAFTGAVKEKPGCFEMADGGTLFLDEVGEMAPDTQSKLLRALEERKIRRLGGNREISVDVRIISATNIAVQKALQEGKLREDLYFRLSVIDIEVPPLRDRPGDLPILVEDFLAIFNRKNQKNVTGFSPEAMALLSGYHWPGNIRELKNAVERAVILCTGEVAQVEHLPGHIRATKVGGSGDQVGIGRTLHDIEKEVIFKTLRMTNNNKTKAARILGISLKTMHNKLNKYLLENEVDGVDEQ